MPQNILTERLDAGPVVCAEGFLFELERRGYLTAGEFVPEVALEHPEALRTLHVDFQRAGSDIVEAFTYNGCESLSGWSGTGWQVERRAASAPRPWLLQLFAPIGCVSMDMSGSGVGWPALARPTPMA